MSDLDLVLLGAVGFANTAAFLLWGLDKWRARRNRRRVPEATLLGWAFATGIVGAWVGVSVFRHKTRKASFRWKLFAVTVVNPLWLLLWWRLGAGG